MSGKDPTTIPVDSGPEAGTNMVKLGTGEALTMAEAALVSGSQRAPVIVLAGPASCGKTTLLTSLYQRFQEGSFGGFHFAGSLTLVGFERRCHLSRVASGQEMADTERTKFGLEDQILHLRLAPGEPARPIDLLLSDLAGETFRRIRDDTRECASVPLLWRADHLAVLLDGKQLASTRERNGVRSDARQLLRACFDSGVLQPDVTVEVVATKWDLIRAAGEDAESFARETAAAVQEVILGRPNRTTVSLTAARSSQPAVLPAGYGIDELIRLWTGKMEPWRTKMAAAIPNPPNRSFERFRNY